MSRAVSIAAALSSALFFAHAAAADITNLLTNGSFETGDFSGWTESGNFTQTTVEPGGSGPYPAEDGGYYVLEGPFGSLGYLSQSFGDQEGQPYTISGWVYGSGWEPSEVVFYWDGVAAITVDPVEDYGQWTQFAATVIGTGSDTFTVGFRNDPAFDGLDNFWVVAGTDPGGGSGGSGTPGGPTIPEAPVWIMMLVGFGGLGLASYRARRRSVASA